MDACSRLLVSSDSLIAIAGLSRMRELDVSSAWPRLRETHGKCVGARLQEFLTDRRCIGGATGSGVLDALQRSAWGDVRVEIVAVVVAVQDARRDERDPDGPAMTHL